MERKFAREKQSRSTPPHDHDKSLGQYHLAGPAEIEAAISGSQRAFQEWSSRSYKDRAAVMLKAADLLTTKHRYLLNAATMLCQGKTCHQAEIDSACELIDFLRFNVSFQEQIHSIQPVSPDGMKNKLEYRALEGFIFAVTPFNFTAISGNLPSSAALMGNVTLWKPASAAVYSSYYFYKILEEAGLPPGVIQFIPGSGATVGSIVMKNENLAGVNFTGSTGVFQNMWKEVGNNIAKYKSYPRIVGETGGKDFVFAHSSANLDVLSTAIVRGAFEYSGQKCSAASRAYIPESVWPGLKDKLISQVSTIKMGDVADFKNFMSAVIDQKSFDNIKSYIDYAKASNDATIIVGGKTDDSKGYFVEPTIIETTDPKFKSMVEEIFGPIITVYVYEDTKFEETIRLCNETSPYALTGCVIAQDRSAIDLVSKVLTHAAGNFYINNKPSGAVVGQQPFGGGRASGTNDKAGAMYNLIRWTSMRTVSETLAPPTDFRYPFMQ